MTLNEKKLSIALLTEKLQNMTGKKVILENIFNFDKATEDLAWVVMGLYLFGEPDENGNAVIEERDVPIVNYIKELVSKYPGSYLNLDNYGDWGASDIYILCKDMNIAKNTLKDLSAIIKRNSRPVLKFGSDKFYDMQDEGERGVGLQINIGEDEIEKFYKTCIGENYKEFLEYLSSKEIDSFKMIAYPKKIVQLYNDFSNRNN